MAHATYEEALRLAPQLTPEERARLSNFLSGSQERPTGADFVAFLQTAEPIRPEALDAMEEAIKELDVIDPNEW